VGPGRAGRRGGRDHDPGPALPVPALRRRGPGSLPRGILHRRLYSAGAIALALALWGVTGLAPPEVRRRVSPFTIVGATAAAGWASLRRWSRAVRAWRLFPVVRALPGEASLRQVAARAATTLAAYAPGAGGLPIDSAAFLGAAHVR